MESSSAAESFHRQDFSSAAFQSQHETGEHGLAIQKHRTRAAFAQLTAMLRARVPEVLAQNFQQLLVWCKRHVDFFPVQHEPDLRCLLRLNRERRHVPSPREYAIQLPYALAYPRKPDSERRAEFPFSQKNLSRSPPWLAGLGLDSPPLLLRSLRHSFVRPGETTVRANARLRVWRAPLALCLRERIRQSAYRMQ